MPRDELRELAKHRLDNAKIMLKSARLLLDSGDYKSVCNRSYYAVFNAMRACLAPLGIDHKKHSGVMSDFRLHFIKTGKFNNDLSDIIAALFYARTQSDYNDFYVISKGEVLKQLESANLFVNQIDNYLAKCNWNI